MATLLSHRQKILLGDRDPVVLLHGKRKGSPFFAYLVLTLENLTRMNYDMEHGRLVKLNDYGRVVMQGKGEPNDDQKAYMERHYSFDHHDPFGNDDAPSQMAA